MLRVKIGLMLALMISACSGEYERSICSEGEDNCLIVTPAATTIIDADTISHKNIRYRLYRWDGPEIGQYAQCPEENTLGRQALFAAQRTLTGAQSVTIHVLDETATGVKLADVFIDDEEFGSQLEEEGFLVPWDHESKEKKPDWCQ